MKKNNYLKTLKQRLKQNQEVADWIAEVIEEGKEEDQEALLMLHKTLECLGSNESLLTLEIDAQS